MLVSSNFSPMMTGLFLGVAAGVVVGVPLFLWLKHLAKQKHRSALKGICRFCGYHIGELNRCPECGAKVD